MMVISHRGNLNGRDEEIENHPKHIDKIISAYMMNVEVDLRIVNGTYWLGHDEPQYKIDYEWLHTRRNFLWIHCKNHEALLRLQRREMQSPGQDLNFFWHESDDFTMTSRGVLWANVGIELPPRLAAKAVAVMPEINNTDTSRFWGICTDWAEHFYTQ